RTVSQLTMAKTRRVGPPRAPVGVAGSRRPSASRSGARATARSPNAGACRTGPPGTRADCTDATVAAESTPPTGDQAPRKIARLTPLPSIGRVPAAAGAVGGEPFSDPRR